MLVLRSLAQHVDIQNGIWLLFFAQTVSCTASGVPLDRVDEVVIVGFKINNVCNVSCTWMWLWWTPCVIWHRVVASGDEPVSIFENSILCSLSFLNNACCVHGGSRGTVGSFLCCKPTSKCADAWIVLEFCTAMCMCAATCLILNTIPVPICIQYLI